MNPLHDANPTTYTVFYEDGRVTSGHSYLESLEIFNSREQTGAISVAPTTTDVSFK